MKRPQKAFLFTTVCAAVLSGGCAPPKAATRYRAYFLPPSAPVTVDLGALEAPPPPPYYTPEFPAILDTPQVTVAKSRADALVRRADESYQRGRRSYQVKDLDAARKEFDEAVGLMLEACAANPDGRGTYQSLLDGMVDSIHRFDLTDFGAASEDDDARFEKAPLEDILEMTFPVDPKLKDRVREQVAATSSQLPLSVNDAVLGYIHYFSNRGRGTIRNGMARSGRYRDMIHRVLDEEGVPQEIICLAQAESGFMPRAMSRAKAGGMWQFLVWRGNEYGLERTAYIDERLDPEKATRAAARHLRDLYQQFGDWYLAMAAYNCGPVNVERAVERTGYADFWELRNRGVLPKETTNYVPIVLAMIIMEKNAAEYDLDQVAFLPPLEYDTAEMSAPTSLWLISDIVETPVAELAAMNPSLLKGVAPAGYAVHVPRGSAASLIPALQLVPAENRGAWRLHRVSTGDDTLAGLAQRYSLTAARIQAVNKTAFSAALDGEYFVIPAAPKPATTAKKTAAKKTSTAKKTTDSAASKPSATTSQKSATQKPAAKSGSTAQTTAPKAAPKSPARSRKPASTKSPAQVAANKAR